MDAIELHNVSLYRETTSVASQENTDIAPGPRATQAYQAANGGTTGWLRVAGSFLSFINTGGVAASFGAYQSFYQTDKLASHSPSSISWIGTTQVFLWGFGGVIAGPLYDRGYVRLLLIAGGLLLVLGQFMLSLSKTYAEVFLAQGICMGICRSH